jgi:hypothetical protein
LLPLATNELGTLDSVALGDYNYWCQELFSLTNSSTNCSLASGMEGIEEKNAASIPFPNPFSNRILWPGKEGRKVALMDSEGKLIYRGNALESIDFSELKPGSYFLKDIENPKEIHQLIKK